MKFGDFELISLSDGTFRLDGGAMFGVVPKTMWQKRTTADEKNRIPLGLRPLLVRTPEHTVLIDSGVGDKMPPKLADIYAIDRTRHLDHSLADAGLTSDDITVVIASHLHFDHFGGSTKREGDTIVPRFRNARYLIRRDEWHDATHTHDRNRASYMPENFLPLAEAGVVDFIEGDGEVLPGISIWQTGGHCLHHSWIRIQSGGRTAAFVADLIPTTAHLDEPWIMGYDLYPMDTLFAKQAFARAVARRETLVFFEHDPAVPAAFITEQQGKLGLRPTT